MRYILARSSFTIALMGIYLTQGGVSLKRALRFFNKREAMDHSNINKGNINLSMDHANINMRNINFSMDHSNINSKRNINLSMDHSNTNNKGNILSMGHSNINNEGNINLSMNHSNIKNTENTNLSTQDKQDDLKVIQSIEPWTISTKVQAATTTTPPTASTQDKVSIKPTSSSTSEPLHVILKSGQKSALYLSNFTNFVVNSKVPSVPEGDKYNVGLYAVVVNQFTGYSMGEAFHLQPWADFRHLKYFIESIQPGRIVICLLRKDLVHEIPEEIRILLRKEGSEFIGFLGPGMTWTWAWIKGGSTIAEGMTSPTAQKMAPRHLISIEIRLDKKADICPEWPADPHWQKRREFCSKYERYEDLCACKNPYSLEMTQQKIDGSVIEKAVLVILAYRVPDLYRTLKSLASASGFNRNRVEVYTEKSHPELTEFLLLAGIPLTMTRQTHELVSTLIARQLVFALNHTLNSHPEADFLIFMEEDVRVSPDFFVFLNRSATLLKEDKSLYCVTAHNDLSYPHTSHDPKTVLRTESYPDYGWMVHRAFAEEMVMAMSALDREFDWDVFTYYHIRKGRECIVPEVSRSQHFTRGGSHISQWAARRFFTNKNLNLDPNATVEKVERLRNDTYESYLKNQLEKARFIDPSLTSPCRDDFYSLYSPKEEEVLVLFFFTNSNIDYFRINIQWSTLADCLGTFSMESREGHRGLYRMRYGAAHFFLIAYPASPYSHYKPTNVGVFNATEEEQIYAQNRRKLKEMPYDLQVPEIFDDKLLKDANIT